MKSVDVKSLSWNKERKVLHELHIHLNKRVTWDRFSVQDYRLNGKGVVCMRVCTLTHEASSGCIFVVSVFTIKGSVTFEREIDARSIVTIKLGSRIAFLCKLQFGRKEEKKG